MHSFIAAMLIAANPAPEIAHVFPDFPRVSSVRVITGENFVGKKVFVWVMRSPRDEAVIPESAKTLGLTKPELPDRPPKGSHRQPPLDVEAQVITVDIGHHFAPMALWVETEAGFSKPYPVDSAKPFWVSRSTARPGGVLYIYGFGLRYPYAKTHVVLKSKDATLFAKLVTMARARRVKDRRLVHFEVPREAVGSYGVYVHNSRGGQYGWRKAGEIEVVTGEAKPKPVLDVCTFGAKGDGLANDADAIAKALAATQEADGAVVFLPPGTYRTDRTLHVPDGVSLRGASRENTIIQGFGYDPLADRVAWHRPGEAPATPVVRMGNGVSIESLTVTGATSKGPGGFAMLEAVPTTITFPLTAEVHDLVVKDCRLDPRGDLTTGRSPYRNNALYFGPKSRRVTFVGNEVYGGCAMYEVRRLDMVGNKFHEGNVSGRMWQGLVDANLFVDTPTRFLLYPRRHCHIRFNEIHQAFRGSWCNAEETYLVHGGFRKHFGSPTQATATTLTDTQHHWTPGQHKENTILITAGRGLGQYRHVVDNTADTLILEKPWRVVPDPTSEYVVGGMYVENDFFANLNNTPLRLSLWLDVIGNIVDMHRDVYAKGSDIWGQDRSRIDKEGKARGADRFHPAFYNMILNSWMDGSMAHLWSGADAANVYRGTPMFANYVVANKIRSPHMHRTGFSRDEIALGGVIVGNASNWNWRRPGKPLMKPQDERVALSHSVVQDNFITFTNAGITVSDFADKTFLLGNRFQKVDQPILDWGASTHLRGNKVFHLDEKGEHFTPIGDRVGERKMKPRPRPEYTIPKDEAPSQLYDTVVALHVFVSRRPMAIYSGVDSQDACDRCASNLKRVYDLLSRYEAKHGTLPKASFFPEQPLEDEDSLAVLLGKGTGEHLVCPTCGPDFQSMGLNYIWNVRVSGKKLTNIDKPSETWLLMDFVAVHDYMVKNRYCGHLGKVNILYADGRVELAEPPLYQFRRKTPEHTYWIDWAKLR